MNIIQRSWYAVKDNRRAEVKQKYNTKAMASKYFDARELEHTTSNPLSKTRRIQSTTNEHGKVCSSETDHPTVISIKYEIATSHLLIFNWMHITFLLSEYGRYLLGRNRTAQNLVSEVMV